MNFKVGDRVRLTGKYWKNEFAGGAAQSMWGTEHVITRVWGDGDPMFNYDGEDWFIVPDGYEAELVQRGNLLVADEDESADQFEKVEGRIVDLSGSNPTDPETPAPWFPLDLEKIANETPFTVEDIAEVAKVAESLGVRVPDPYEDKVNPSHYSQYGIEVIDLVRHMPYTTGNVVKYVTRAPFKGQEVEDLLKARQYLDWAIEDAKARGMEHE